jgi:hypothetical protein
MNGINGSLSGRKRIFSISLSISQKHGISFMNCACGSLPESLDDALTTFVGGVELSQTAATMQLGTFINIMTFWSGV